MDLLLQLMEGCKALWMDGLNGRQASLPPGEREREGSAVQLLCVRRPEPPKDERSSGLLPGIRIKQKSCVYCVLYKADV